ncbi:hypothetical protein CF326_g3863 [Tilletia indica]|nr:hypothetical protein CF326_g3863 [Tilletia indica]
MGDADEDGSRVSSWADHKLSSRIFFFQLDEVYNFSESNDGEILLRFYEVALEVEAGKFAKKAAAWVQTVGRMKYVRPIYRALNRVDRKLAVKTFEEARDFYHPICRALLQKDLGLS